MAKSAAETQPTNQATLDDLIPGDDVRVALSGKSREVVAYFVFAPMDTATLRKYRTIYHGPPGSRKGKPGEAVRFVFKEKFQKTENLELNLEGYATETEFFLKNDRGQLVMDKVVNSYLDKVMPDEDESGK